MFMSKSSVRNCKVLQRRVPAGDRRPSRRRRLLQRELGHANIQLTVDTYGRWLPRGNKAAVDRLDDAPPGLSVFGGTGAFGTG